MGLIESELRKLFVLLLAAIACAVAALLVGAGSAGEPDPARDPDGPECVIKYPGDPSVTVVAVLNPGEECPQ